MSVAKKPLGSDVLNHRSVDRATLPGLRVLVLSDEASGLDAMVPVPAASGVSFATLPEVTAASLALDLPDVVLSPLVAERFDCFDVAAQLSEAGFSGRYRAAAGPLPDPGLVLREVRAQFPALDFDIVFLNTPDVSKMN